MTEKLINTNKISNNWCESNKVNKGSLLLMSLKLSSLLQGGMVHFEKSQKISSQPLIVWFQKISIPHHEGNWKFQAGGGETEAQEIPERRGVGR